MATLRSVPRAVELGRPHVHADISLAQRVLFEPGFQFFQKKYSTVKWRLLSLDLKSLVAGRYHEHHLIRLARRKANYFGVFLSRSKYGST